MPIALGLAMLLLLLPAHVAEYCNATSCYPCHYTCQICEGLLSTDCIGCLQDYVLKDGLCSPCGMNCMVCQTNPVDDSAYCQTCLSGFYLDQATQVCAPCPTGATSCTYSAIQQCSSSYFLWNSNCQPCIVNCLSCSSSSSCLTCLSGYQLTSGNTCISCVNTHCKQCQPDNSCLSCYAGYYGSQCQSACARNCSVCQQQTCYECMSTYYLSQNSTCEAMSVLCSAGIGPFSCLACVADIATYDGSNCIPMYSVHGFNTQTYRSALNTPDAFLSSSLVLCPSFNYQWSLQNLTVELMVPSAYALKLQAQIVTNSTTQLTISSPQLVQSFTTKPVSNYSYTCGSSSLLLSNVQTMFTLKSLNVSSANTTSFITFHTASASLVGVTELLVEFYLCQVEDCVACSSRYSCTACLQSYYLQDNVCVIFCDTGYYETSSLSLCSFECPPLYYPDLEDYSCLPCESPCLECSSLESCTSCLPGFYESNSDCVSTCPAGYFANTIKSICDRCLFPCNQCTQTPTNCTSCTVGYLNAIFFRCVMFCDDGHYADFNLGRCQPCDSPCKTCSYTATSCTTCLNGLFANAANLCVSDCGLGYAADTTTGTCSKCSYPCKTCLAKPTTCQSCYIGYLSMGKCLSSCPNGMYQQYQGRTCVSCPIACASCDSATACTTCSLEYLFVPSLQSCLLSCPDNTYASGSTCNSCQPPCLACASATSCITCVGYLFIAYLGSCVLSCPTSTYLSVNPSNAIVCLTCSANCLSCLSPTLCLQCDGSFLYNGLCLHSCPTQAYPDTASNFCVLCVYPCYSCNAIYSCLSCSPGYSLLPSTSSCVQSCPGGYFTFEQQCTPCQPQCAYCNDATAKCISCNTGYFQGTIGYCVSSCAPGSYQATIDHTCKPCDVTCLTCLQLSICLTCNKTSSYPHYFQFVCLPNCPDGYYPTVDLSCQPCSHNCAECTAITTNCTSCSSQLYILFKLTNGVSVGSCVTACPDGHFASSDGNCVSCVPPCSRCLAESLCISCLQSTYSLLNYNCYPVCPIGYYTTVKDGLNLCSPCGPQCRQCQHSALNCTLCVNNYYLLVNNANTLAQCVASCPELMYGSPVSHVCLPCQSPCLACFKSGFCHSCISGYLLQDENCVTACSDGYYQRENHAGCSACISPCSTCTRPENCLSCVAGYYFVEETLTCVTMCPAKMYGTAASNGIGQCLHCSETCGQCFDFTACKSCEPSSTRPFLEGTSCLSSCNQGYFQDSNGSYICKPCSDSCVFCTYIGSCNQCRDSFLHEGYCLGNCPSHYYSSITFTCEPCSLPCMQCYDQANCQSCISGYYLYLHFCLLQCPSNQWTVVSEGICVSACDTSKYFLDTVNRRCVSSCPIYYNNENECVSACNQDMMANQTLGCESCLTASCADYLTFEVDYLLDTGKFLLLLLFNQSIDSYDHFHISGITVGQYHIVIDRAELGLTALRTLQATKDSSNNSALTLISTSPTSLCLSVQFPSQQFTGNVNVSITNFSMVYHNGYPVQNQRREVQVPEYHPTDATAYSRVIAVIGYIVCSIVLLMLLCNLVLENFRSMIVAIDVLQNLHMLVYLAVWWHPAVEAYLQSLNILAFKAVLLAPSLFNSSTAPLGKCMSKRIYIYGFCDILNQLHMAGIFCGVTALAIPLLRCCLKREGNYLINQLNTLYWLFCMSLGVSAFFYLNNTSGFSLTLAITTALLFVLLSLLLAYQIIKNTFNCSFEEKCFFWALTKQKTVNQISHLHLLFLLIRRMILVMIIGISPKKPLTCLFLSTLATIFIVSNMIINKPFKLHQTSLLAVEILFVLVLILLQMYIVNAPKMGTQSWNVFGFILLVLMLLLTVLVLAIALFECYQLLLKRYAKLYEQQKVKELDSPKEGIQSQQKEDKQQQQRQEPESAEGTKVQDRREEDSSDSVVFSNRDSEIISSLKPPPAYLVRVDKPEQTVSKDSQGEQE